ncbi:MAG: hypothetical protein NPMRD1_60015 [Nitrosopumilales archaeon]|nr:MAG: hypothetical protein NPMRD1_60015 [Nitrosopumilales archaeon]
MIQVMILVKESTGKKPKKKQGRPKAAKSKPKVKAPKEKPTQTSFSKASLTSAEKDVAAKLKTLRAAAEEAAEKEYKAAEAEAVTPEATQSFTNKRGLDLIFRREMGEPEFWLEKNNRGPLSVVLSPAEEAAISRKVEIPADQTPKYRPEHILSAEFGGTSSYEIGIKNQREEIEQRLIRLKNDPNASAQEINLAEEDLKTLDYLYENFYVGMNVFRTAKGGRAKLRV